MTIYIVQDQTAIFKLSTNETHKPEVSAECPWMSPKRLPHACEEAYSAHLDNIVRVDILN